MPHAVARPLIPRAYRCRCGRPIFFRNSECLACHTALGYDPERRMLLPIEQLNSEAAGQGQDQGQGQGPGLWRAAVGRRTTRRYRRCSHLESVSACNWLVEASDRHAGTPALCRCCRLTRTLPDLSQPENGVYWRRIARDQRRLVSTLIGLGLPVKSKMSEDPKRGLVFDLLRSPPGGAAVCTGHADGVITLDVEEADDARREERRNAMNEPYRTLLGHLRHESGHYYWQRLVAPGPWLEPVRALFGDERQDYAAALRRHYEQGAPADWPTRHVSAYASSHPWEDWAETWAHYLHLRDTLDTARSFGLDGETVELNYERYGLDALGKSDQADPAAPDFLSLVNGWMELTGVLNELSRSMGVPDFYPFVLSAAALRKLFLIHRVVGAPI